MTGKRSYEAAPDGQREVSQSAFDPSTSSLLELLCIFPFTALMAKSLSCLNRLLLHVYKSLPLMLVWHQDGHLTCKIAFWQLT